MDSSEKAHLFLHDPGAGLEENVYDEQPKLVKPQARLMELEAEWLMYTQYAIGRHGYGKKRGGPSFSRDMARGVIFSGLALLLLFNTAEDWWKTGSLMLLVFAAPFTVIALFSFLVSAPASREFERRRGVYEACRKKLREEIDLGASG